MESRRLVIEYQQKKMMTIAWNLRNYQDFSLLKCDFILSFRGGQIEINIFCNVNKALRASNAIAQHRYDPPNVGNVLGNSFASCQCEICRNFKTLIGLSYKKRKMCDGKIWLRLNLQSKISA